MIRIDLQMFGGRGASIPKADPDGGGGGGGQGLPKDQMPGNPETLAEALGKKGRPMSAARAVLNANPFYDENYGDYSENCQRAVAATEARFRGYDVIASPTYDGDMMPHGNNFASVFKNARVEDVGHMTARATRNDVESRMKSYGDGARAILRVGWKGRAYAHVINLVQKNGRTYYYDGQIGARYDGNTLFREIKRGQTATKIVRVDNLDFSENAKKAFRQNPFRKGNQK